MFAGTLIIRADASGAIGHGHVVRCLALAQAWQDVGGQCVFAAAQLDPEVDPFDVAGRFLMRSVLKGMGAKTDPKALFYQTQRLKVRFMRVVEAIERLIGARPGQKLEVNFRAATLEQTIRRAGRRLALALTAGAAILGTALTAVSEKVAGWVPVAFGVSAFLLTLGLVVDLLRKPKS